MTYAGNPNNLLDFNGRTHYEFMQGNICNTDLIKEILESRSMDFVVNFAAESFVDKSINSSKPFVDSNVDGVRSLLDASRTVGIKRFVQISTDEVYGSAAVGQFNEESSYNPRNPYSATKAAGEHLAKSYFITYGLPIVITRSSNNYGPYQYPEKFIPLAITNLIEGKKIPVYGTGKNVRDWIYVIDNCKAIYLVMEKGRIGEIYNIGGGNEWENVSIARCISRYFGKQDDAIEFVMDRPGHDFRYSLSCEKVRCELGWKPATIFDEGLKETIEWYKKNEWWWKPLKKELSL